MKPSFIALGTSLACAGAAHAQSPVQLTGLVDAYAGSMRMAGDAGSKGVVGTGGMTTSWWGLKGREDLGSGLQLDFNLTAFMRVDTGSPARFDGDPYFSREANVGLSGGFGTVRLGRSMAPNFLPTILSNPFGDSFAISPLGLHTNVGTAVWGSARLTASSDTIWSNQVVYSTPKFGGLSANVHYQFGEQAGNSGKKNIGVNALYFGGPLSLTAFYERAQISNPVSLAVMPTKTDWMLGGSYNFEVAKLYATCGQARIKDLNRKNSSCSMGLDVPLSSAGTVKAAIARTKAEAGVADSTRTTVSVGYDHYLSRRTDVYTVLMHDRITDLKSGTSLIAGMRHRF